MRGKYWYERRWRRVASHIDARHCPHCACSVHGNLGQSEHLQHHLDEAEREEKLEAIIQELCKRTGITEEEVELPWAWTAVVDSGPDELEAGG